MRPSIIAVFVCLCLSLWPAGARAQSGNDPSEMFLTAYQDAQKGDAAESTGNYPAALRAYQEAAQQLEQIRTRFPTWNPQVVDFRYKKVVDSSARMQKKGAAAGGGDDVVPAPPGADPGDTEIFPPLPRKTPRTPPAPKTPSGAPVVPGNAESALQQIARERERMMAELEQNKKAAAAARNESDDLRRQFEAEKAAKEAFAEKLKGVEGRADALEKSLRIERERDTKDEETIQKLQAQVEGSRRELTDLRLDGEARDVVEAQRKHILDRALSRAKDAQTITKTAEMKVADADKRVAEAEQKATAAIERSKKTSDELVNKANTQITVITRERDEALGKLTVITKERDEARRQYAQLQEGSKQVDKLLTENNRLQAKLAEEDKLIAQYKTDSTRKDQLIASLQKEVTTVKIQLADAQKQSATFQTQMIDLKKQLEGVSTDLAAQKTTTAAQLAEKKELQVENEILKGIAAKQARKGAINAALTQAVLQELASSNANVSKATIDKLHDIGSPLVNLTPQERKLFKQPVVELDQISTGPRTPPEPPVAKVPPVPPAPPATPAPAPAVAVVPPSTPAPAPATPAGKKNGRVGKTATPAPATPVQVAKLDLPPKPLPLPPAKTDDSGLNLAVPPPSGATPLLPSNPLPEPPPAAAPTPAAPPSPAVETTGPAATDEPVLSPELVSLVRRGKDEFERSDYHAAEKTYEDILRKAPTNVYALKNLGVVRYRLGKNALAEESLRKAIKFAPEDGFSHCTLGIVYYVELKYDGAVDELTKALAINPKDPVAHNYLGITASQKGWADAAQKELETAVAWDANYADAWFNLAVVYATKKDGKDADKDNARRCYKKAVALGAEADPALEGMIK